MANKRFSDFDLRSPVQSADYFVGFKKDGSSEFKTTFADIQLSLPIEFKYLGEDIKVGIQALSGNWEETYTLFNSNSANLISTYSNVYSLSSDWHSTYASMFELSSKWLDTYTTYSANSSTYITTATESQSLSFNESSKQLSITNGNVVSLSSLIDYENAFSVLSAKYEDVSTVVQQNSAQWLDGGTAADLLMRGLSADLVSVYSTVRSNSAVEWNASLNISNLVSPLTGNWQSTYTTVLANSASKWSNLTSVEYSALTGLKAAGLLNPGQFYRISDFQLKWWNQSVNDLTVKTGPIEPLIVLAISPSEVSHTAYSEMYPDDTLYYDIDAKSSTTWGTLSGSSSIPLFKGWVYRRVNSTNNIDIAWDWRNITVNCCRVDTTSISAHNPLKTYEHLEVVKVPSGKLYYSVKAGNFNPDLQDATAWLPVSPFNESTTYFPTDESGYAFVALNYGSPTTSWLRLSALPSTRIQQPTFVIGADIQSPLRLINCRNIKIDGGHSNVIYGVDFKDNNIGDDFSYNLIGADFKNNSIDSDFSSNLIGENFESNSIGDKFCRNVIGEHFSNNSIQDCFETNNISGYFTTNTCLREFENNIIGNSFFTNEIENSFYGNVIANNFTKNDVGNNFLFNVISNNFRKNQIQDSCITFKNLITCPYFYGEYHTNVFRNFGNDVRLSYFNAQDQLIVTDIVSTVFGFGFWNDGGIWNDDEVWVDGPEWPLAIGVWNDNSIWNDAENWKDL